MTRRIVPFGLASSHCSSNYRSHSLMSFGGSHVFPTRLYTRFTAFINRNIHSLSELNLLQAASRFLQPASILIGRFMFVRPFCAFSRFVCSHLQLHELHHDDDDDDDDPAVSQTLRRSSLFELLSASQMIPEQH